MPQHFFRFDDEVFRIIGDFIAEIAEFIENHRIEIDEFRHERKMALQEQVVGQLHGEPHVFLGFPRNTLSLRVKCRGGYFFLKKTFFPIVFDGNGIRLPEE